MKPSTSRSITHGKLNRADAKSLALFQAIRDKLEHAEDPEMYFLDALTWVRKFRPTMPEVAYLERWETLLESALNSMDARIGLLNWMVSENDDAIVMRSCSPFSGVLTQRERTDVLIQFAKERPDEK
ncbi:MAG: hypothetical protein M0Z50_18985 [Planctomycetia bacterium]|nr:hypothetical protein [Planctomycetia bacterium]